LATQKEIKNTLNLLHKAGAEEMHNQNKREMLRMAAKAGSQKEFILNKDQENETVFLFQHPGVRAGVQMRGRSKDANGMLDEDKYYTELMKHVIFLKDGDGVKSVGWDYWEENSEGFLEVMKEASSFLID
jgi:hypothetical protein